MHSPLYQFFKELLNELCVYSNTGTDQAIYQPSYDNCVQDIGTTEGQSSFFTLVVSQGNTVDQKMESIITNKSIHLLVN